MRKESMGLVPIKLQDSLLLETLKAQLEAVFPVEVETGGDIPIPRGSYNEKRNQFFSPVILRELSRVKKYHKILGVMEGDLYTLGLNFIFGQAAVHRGTALISVARLRQSFYGLEESRELFLSRAVKESVHETGHLYRLSHCRDPGCVMHFSSSLPDTDRKSSSFCSSCAGFL